MSPPNDFWYRRDGAKTHGGVRAVRPFIRSSPLGAVLISPRLRLQQPVAKSTNLGLLLSWEEDCTCTALSSHLFQPTRANYIEEDGK